MDPGCIFFRETAIDLFNVHADKTSFLQSHKSIQELLDGLTEQGADSARQTAAFDVWVEALNAYHTRTTPTKLTTRALDTRETPENRPERKELVEPDQPRSSKPKTASDTLSQVPPRRYNENQTTGTPGQVATDDTRLKTNNESRTIAPRPFRGIDRRVYDSYRPAIEERLTSPVPDRKEAGVQTNQPPSREPLVSHCFTSVPSVRCL